MGAVAPCAGHNSELGDPQAAGVGAGLQELPGERRSHRQPSDAQPCFPASPSSAGKSAAGRGPCRSGLWSRGSRRRGHHQGRSLRGRLQRRPEPRRAGPRRAVPFRRVSPARRRTSPERRPWTERRAPCAERPRPSHPAPALRPIVRDPGRPRSRNRPTSVDRVVFGRPPARRPRVVVPRGVLERLPSGPRDVRGAFSVERRSVGGVDSRAGIFPHPLACTNFDVPCPRLRPSNGFVPHAAPRRVVRATRLARMSRCASTLRPAAIMILNGCANAVQPCMSLQAYGGRRYRCPPANRATHFQTVPEHWACGKFAFSTVTG